jgi:hypothetical protein
LEGIDWISDGILKTVVIPFRGQWSVQRGNSAWKTLCRLLLFKRVSAVPIQTVIPNKFGCVPLLRKATVHDVSSTTEPATVNERLSVEINRAVADLKGVEPTELDFNLDDYIDSDGVDALASNNDTSWTLSFDLPKTSVTVTGDGLIRVRDSQRETLTVQRGETTRRYNTS